MGLLWYGEPGISNRGDRVVGRCGVVMGIALADPVRSAMITSGREVFRLRVGESSLSLRPFCLSRATTSFCGIGPGPGVGIGYAGCGGMKAPCGC